MNVDHILETFNAQEVEYLLIGGVNFLLRHTPVITYDVDFWIEDTAENRARCEIALAALDAEWGASDDDWGPVAARPPGWLAAQGVFCLTSPHGALDVFRSVKGLSSWAEARSRAHTASTVAGSKYVGLSDRDMLECQLALSQRERNEQRIRTLTEALQREPDGPES